MTESVAESVAKFATFQDSKGRAVTAAAQVLNGPRIKRTGKLKASNGKGMPWQVAAWEFVDVVGEFSWAVELLATSVSKVSLVAARDVLGVDEPVVLDGGDVEVDGETRAPSKLETDAAGLIAGFAGGTSGQQQLMYRAAFQLIVAAETYVVGRQLEDGEAKWDAYSNEEITVSNNGWEVNDGTEKFRISDDDVLIRIWRPHPRRRSEPRSSTKPLLPVLAEIKGLTQSIAARIDSRLAGAGVLFVPESMSLLTSQSAKLEDGDDPFVAELMDAMLTSIGDRDTAAAVVPIVVRVPDDAIGKVQHIRFEVTAKAEEALQRADAILRMARSVDLPQEQVLGMGDSNHWSAWAIDEDTAKGPVATLEAIIVHGLTVGYLRPALIELGHDPAQVDELLTWYDLSKLVERPDKSAEAFNIYGIGGLSLKSLLRESGLSESDLPTEEDTCRRLLLQLIETDPSNAGKWVQVFGECAGLTLPPMTDLFGDGTAMIPQQTTPAIEPPPENNRDIPELAASVTVLAAADGTPILTKEVIPAGGCPDATDCLYSACEVAVLRALDLAGKRMRGSSPRNMRSGLMAIPSHELHANPSLVASVSTKWTTDDLLEGAWTPLEIALPGRPALVKDLDDYARLLIDRQQLHDPSWLRPIVAKNA